MFLSILGFRIYSFLAIGTATEGLRPMTKSIKDPLGEALRIESLARAGDLSGEEIAKMIGISADCALNRLHLLRLAPALQKRLTDSERRLHASVGGALGGMVDPSYKELCDIARKLGRSPEELPEDSETNPTARRFFLQQLLVSEVERRKLKARAAIKYIRGRVKDLAATETFRSEVNKRTWSVRKQKESVSRASRAA